jgi:hypothetical protein
MPNPGGSLMITGDPELEAYAAQSGVVPGTTSPQDVLNPVAALWSTFWQSQRDQSIRPPWMRHPTPRPTGPGSPGFGVLDETKAPKGGFYLDKQADRAAGVDAQYATERARLQGLADAILGRPASPSEVGDVWSWAIEQIDAAEELGADPVDPWHWLEQRKAQAEAEAAEENGPRTVTQTQRTVNLTDPVTAGAVIDMTLRNLLGRRARDDEREQFLSTLRSQEQANPTVSTTTTNYGPEGESVDSSTTTTGGAPDPGTAAQSWADQERLGEQKAVLAASYYDILRGL